MVVVNLKPHSPWGSGCPVSPFFAFTAFHVATGKDEIVWDVLSHRGKPEFKALTIRWGNEQKDLTLLFSKDQFPYFFPIATEMPKNGDAVTTLGIFVDDTNDMIYSARYEGHILHADSRSIFVDSMILPGSSGGCVLNAQNEVIGIVSSIQGSDEASARSWLKAASVVGEVIK